MEIMKVMSSVGLFQFHPIQYQSAKTINFLNYRIEITANNSNRSNYFQERSQMRFATVLQCGHNTTFTCQSTCRFVMSYINS